jgi:restriction system protein
MPPWKEYQEEAADFFRSIGLDASTDVTLQGVRTTHDVDVLVKIGMSGFSVRWIVECKYWKTPVTKLHVLALREIVSDLGADRGIILCEQGFQQGAVEAANLTNVQVTSLAALSETSRSTIAAVRLRELYDRTEACNEKYWAIPKDIRIEKGLRFGLGDEPLYSGARVIEVSRSLLSRAFRGAYPILIGPEHRLFIGSELPERFESADDVVSTLDRLLCTLESKLAAV